MQLGFPEKSYASVYCLPQWFGSGWEVSILGPALYCFQQSLEVLIIYK